MSHRDRPAKRAPACARGWPAKAYACRSSGTTTRLRTSKTSSMDTTSRRAFLASLIGTAAWLPLTGQQVSTPSYVPKQSDRPEPTSGDEPGFEAIFNGRTLEGWEGNPKYWRVENGALVGEVTPATLLQSKTFVIWRRGTPPGFEFEADYRT